MMKWKYVDRTTYGEIAMDGEEQKNGSIVVHHVPFKVEYDGQANVDTKFSEKSVPLVEDPTVLSNQFRGRPLQGRKLDLPIDYEGLVATDLKAPEGSRSTNMENEIAITKRFGSITYWNWDRIPSGMDKHIKLLDWIELSQKLHEPLDD